MASAPGGTQLPLVTDISLVGRWEARGETSTADVMIYAKITPQPSTRISLLHLQPLVLQSTLIRVVPLLPDGTSPWESPGVEALNIATVAGRKQRKVSLGGSVMIDGAGAGGRGAGQSSSPSTASTTRHVSPSRSVGSHDDGLPEPLPNYLSLIKSDTNGDGSDRVGSPALDVSFAGGVALGEDGVKDDDGDDGDLISSVGQRYYLLPGSPAAPKLEGIGINFDRTSDGFIRQVVVGVSEWERIMERVENLQKTDTATSSRKSTRSFVPKVDSDGRIFSSGSFPSIRDISPLPQLRELCRGGLGDEPSPYGQDGTGEFKEKYKEKLRGVKHVLFAGDDGESEGKREQHIAISVENNTLFLCFPQHIRSDPVVVEILLKVRPVLLGQNKNYYTFIFSGLPPCENLAFFDFKIVDTDDGEWIFDAGNHEQTAEFELLLPEEPNRLRGQVNLRQEDTPTKRSIIMRAQQVPSHIEIHGHKIKSKTNVVFSWGQDGKVVAEFEIKVFFVYVEPAEDVVRNLVNLIFINGPDEASKITITSASGNREKFSLEEPVMKDGRELKSARLLQVSRLVGDVQGSMTINFRKAQRSTPCYFHIPLIELGSPGDLLEQVVVIHKPVLPLNMSFTPDLLFWKDMNTEQDLAGLRKISRIANRTGIEYPQVFINSLKPVSSTAADTLSKSKHLKFVDKLTFEIEEHSPALWKSHNPMPLHVRMSFDLQGPPGDAGVELLRMHSGLFQVEFATINGHPAKRLFLDGEELVVLNYGQVYDNEPVRFSVYWAATQPRIINTVGGGKMLEFQLPRIQGCLVGRVVCKYQKDTAQITARAHSLDAPMSEAGPWTVAFVNGKATLSGLQTFGSRLYLQSLLASPPPPLWPPKSQTGSIVDDTETGLVFDEASSLDGPAVLGFSSALDGAVSLPSSIRRPARRTGKRRERTQQPPAPPPPPPPAGRGFWPYVIALLGLSVFLLCAWGAVPGAGVVCSGFMEGLWVRGGYGDLLRVQETAEPMGVAGAVVVNTTPAREVTVVEMAVVEVEEGVKEEEEGRESEEGRVVVVRRERFVGLLFGPIWEWIKMVFARV